MQRTPEDQQNRLRPIWRYYYRAYDYCDLTMARPLVAVVIQQASFPVLYKYLKFQFVYLITQKLIAELIAKLYLSLLHNFKV